MLQETVSVHDYRNTMLSIYQYHGMSLRTLLALIDLVLVGSMTDIFPL